MLDKEYNPDYGMLAYLKAEELSKRLDSFARRAYFGTPPRCTPVKYIMETPVALTADEAINVKNPRAKNAERDFTVIIKLKIANGTGAAPAVSVTFSSVSGGMYSEDTFEILSGTRDYIITGCGAAFADASETAELRVTGAAGCVLVSAEFVYNGNDLFFSAR